MRIAELSRRSGVSVPTIKYYLREGLASIDSPGKTLHETLGKAQYAVTAPLDRQIGEAPLTAAARQVEELVRRRGWRVKATNPAWQLLVQVLATLQELGQHDLVALL